jgi:hypothetical protein
MSLKDLLGKPYETEIEGVKIQIHKFTLQDLCDIQEDLKKAMADASGKEISEVILSNLDLAKKVLTAALKEEVTDLPLDVIAQIIAKIIEVNSELFLQKVLPAIQKLAQKQTGA